MCISRKNGRARHIWIAWKKVNSRLVMILALPTVWCCQSYWWSHWWHQSFDRCIGHQGTCSWVTGLMFICHHHFCLSRIYLVLTNNLRQVYRSQHTCKVLKLRSFLLWLRDFYWLLSPCIAFHTIQHKVWHLVYQSTGEAHLKLTSLLTILTALLPLKIYSFIFKMSTCRWAILLFKFRWRV
jgi:hypothetical protein